MRDCFQEPENRSIVIDKTVRSFDVNDSGDNFCQGTVPVSAARTNKGIPIKKILLNIETKSICSRGTVMVDKQ